jgi:hypothetical protein
MKSAEQLITVLQPMRDDGGLASGLCEELHNPNKEVNDVHVQGNGTEYVIIGISLV